MQSKSRGPDIARKLTIQSTDPFAQIFMTEDQKQILQDQESNDNERRKKEYKALMDSLKAGLIKRFQPTIQQYPWQTEAYYQLSEDRRHTLDHAKLKAKHSDFWYQLQTLTDKIEVFKEIYYDRVPSYDKGFNDRKNKYLQLRNQQKSKELKERQNLFDLSNQVSQKEMALATSQSKQMTTSNSVSGSPPLKVTKKNLFISPSLKDLKEIHKETHRHKVVISEKRSLNYSLNSYSDALTSTRFATSKRYKGNPRMKSLEKLQNSIKEGTGTDSSLVMQNDSSDIDLKIAGMRNFSKVKISKFLSNPNSQKPNIHEFCDKNRLIQVERDKLDEQIKTLDKRKQNLSNTIKLRRAQDFQRAITQFDTSIFKQKQLRSLKKRNQNQILYQRMNDRPQLLPLSYYIKQRQNFLKQAYSSPKRKVSIKKINRKQRDNQIQFVSDGLNSYDIFDNRRSSSSII